MHHQTLRPEESDHSVSANTEGVTQAVMKRSMVLAATTSTMQWLGRDNVNPGTPSPSGKGLHNDLASATKTSRVEPPQVGAYDGQRLCSLYHKGFATVYPGSVLLVLMIDLAAICQQRLELKSLEGEFPLLLTVEQELRP